MTAVDDEVAPEIASTSVPEAMGSSIPLALKLAQPGRVGNAVAQTRGLGMAENIYPLDFRFGV